MVATLKAPGQPRALLGMLLGIGFGFGLVVAEAMWKGKPVIGSAATIWPGSIPETP